MISEMMDKLNIMTWKLHNIYIYQNLPYNPQKYVYYNKN